MFLSWLLPILVASPVLAADLCEDPQATICAPLPEPKLTAATQNLPMVIGYANDTPQQKLEKTHELALRKLESVGINRKDFLDRVSLARKNAIENFSLGRMGPSFAESGPLSNLGLASRMASIDIITPMATAKIFQKPGLAKIFFDFCGSEGLSENLGYVDSAKSVIICPGYLYKLGKQGSLAGLDFLIGHELTHAVDPLRKTSAGSKEWDGVTSEYALMPRYQGYLACVQKEYSPQLEDPTKILSRAKTVKEQLTVQEPNKNYLQRLLKELDSSTQKLKQNNSVIQFLHRRDANASESHSSELVADLGGYKVLIETLKATPKAQRAEVVARNLNRFCQKSELSPARLYDTFMDAGIHPGNEFRLKTFFKDPEVASLLGCKPQTSKSAYCSPDNKNALPLRNAPLTRPGIVTPGAN